MRKECGVEKDALYWTAKYMSQAVASASATDPAWGLAGGLTPLAAVFAAKWRQQVIQDTGNEVWHGCYGTAAYCQGHLTQVTSLVSPFVVCFLRMPSGIQK